MALQSLKFSAVLFAASLLVLSCSASSSSQLESQKADTQSSTNRDKLAALKKKAWIHASLGEYERAIEDVSTAIRLDPGDAEAYFMRFQFYQQTTGEPFSYKGVQDLRNAAAHGHAEAKLILRQHVDY